jgi:hypothetical protein
MSEMLQLSNAYYNQPIMSLRTGGKVAVATEPLINPNNLKIEGFFCNDLFEKKELILLTQDIRDTLPQGFAVDDHSALSDPDDLVRHQKIIDIRYQLPGKAVIVGKRKRLGKVVDYAVEAETMYIQKLYVGQHLLKSLTNGQLSVTRDRIIEITPKYIKVKNPKEPLKKTKPAMRSQAATAS